MSKLEPTLTYSNLTATERLRAMLDECGVEYTGTHPAFTAWWGNHDLYWSAMEVYDGELDLGTNMSSVSPAQAIAATLGEAPSLPHWWTHDGMLHVELPKLPESISVCLPDVRDREVSSARVWHYTLGAGTCHDNGGTDENNQQVFECDACGCLLSLYDRDGVNNLCTSFICDYPRFCPACGRKVVDE